MTIPMCDCWEAEEYLDYTGYFYWRYIDDQSNLDDNTLTEPAKEYWDKTAKKCPHCGKKARAQ